MGNKTVIYRNIHRILTSAWRRRYLIVLPVLVLPVMALLVGITTPKQYMSHTTVLIQETTKLNPFLEDFAVSTQLKERMAGLNALLHSRHMLLAVAKELGRIDSFEDVQAEAVVRNLSNGLSVRLIGSDMIELRFRSHQPDQMVRVLDVVLDHFLRNLLAPERSSVNASETFLQQQLELQASSLLESEKALAQFKAQNSAKLPNQYRFDVEQMRDAEASLREKQTVLAGAQAKTESLKNQLLKTNPMLAQIEESLVRLNAQMSLLKTRYTNQHSQVIAVKRELDRIRIERDLMLETTAKLTNLDLQQLWHLASELNQTNGFVNTRPLLVSQLEALETASADERQVAQEIAQLKSFIEQMSTKLESFAGVEQQLIELERDIETKQSLYNDFLKRYELAKVTGALGRYEESDRVKVIDQPFTPGAPMNPGWVIYLVAGVLGGFALGSGLATVFEISDTRITRREELQNLTGVPVLTRLPRVAELLISESAHHPHQMHS
jgi:polysaccharide chain length determinant protein (PEP-CTERM system associated)